ncbi:MAG TPA: LysR family transcriptional regulator [Polyangiaceae bacterium]|nr:LysR family transcriptional regulator [Polyangiaceae bacterium]
MDRLFAMQVFVRVAELGSFTRAASELGLSRARTSEAVSDLEQALGARLLHRTTRSVTLSDDGRAYHERARQVLADLDDAEALLVGPRGKLRGRLRLALPMALARAFVVPALPAFLARHPELALEVRLENRALHLFEDGVDCAVSYGLPADTGLVAQSIASTHRLTCAAPAYLARRGTPREPAQLEQHDCIPFLALDTGRPAPWSFQARSEDAPSPWQPRGQLGFNSMEACVEAAAAGLGVTQVISSLAAGALKKKRLRAVLGAFVAPGPSIYVVYPPQRQASPRLRALLEFLRAAFASHAG